MLGPIVGCVLIQYLVTKIGSQQAFNANLVLGAVLLAVVLLLPKGVMPSLSALVQAAFNRMRGGVAAPSGQTAEAK